MGKVMDVYSVGSLASSIMGHATDAGGDNTAQALAGLGRDFVTGMDTLGNLAGKTAVFKNAAFTRSMTAATPIIGGGLNLLTWMNDSMGAGGPEPGDRFQNGAKAFDTIDKKLEDLDAPDSWQGTAAPAYTANNEAQKRRARTIEESDRLIQEALDMEAAKIKETRALLDRNATILVAAIPAVLGLRAFGPPGIVAAEALEYSVVGYTVPPAVWAMKYMVSDAMKAATLVRRAGAGYDRAKFGD